MGTITITITTIDSYRKDEGWRSDARNVRRTLSVLVMKTFVQLNAHWRKITWRKQKQQQLPPPPPPPPPPPRPPPAPLLLQKPIKRLLVVWLDAPGDRRI